MGLGRVRSGKLRMLVYRGTRFMTMGLFRTSTRNSSRTLIRNSSRTLTRCSLSRGDDSRGNTPNGKKSAGLRSFISLDLTSIPSLNSLSLNRTSNPSPRQTERAYTPPRQGQQERPEQANTKSSETANGNASMRASCTEQVWAG